MYLRGTSGHGLMYGGQRKYDNLIVGYVDADYAEDLDRKRSLIGYLFTYNNYTINWKARLQSIVALLITEAEYTTIAKAKQYGWKVC